MGSHDFWPKECRATYQRAMNYIFHKLIGRTVEIYIDDVVVKSKSYKEHLANLWETLECMETQLKDEPEQVCFWGISWRVLGFHGA